MDNVERMYRHLVRTIRSKFPQYLTQPFDVAELHQTVLPYRFHRRELGLESNEDYEITLTEMLSGAHDFLIVDDMMRETLKRELATPNPDPTAFKQFASATVALSPAALRSLEAGPDDPTTPLRGPVVSGARKTEAPQLETFDPGAAVVKAPSVSTEVRAPGSSAAEAPPPISSPTDAPAPATIAPIQFSTADTAAVTTPSRPAASPPRISKPTIAPSGARVVVPEPGEQCRSCNETLPPGRPITFCPHCGQNLTTMNCPACGSELEVGWKFCAVCGRPANAS